MFTSDNAGVLDTSLEVYFIIDTYQGFSLQVKNKCFPEHLCTVDNAGVLDTTGNILHHRYLPRIFALSEEQMFSRTPLQCSCSAPVAKTGK